MVTNGSLDASTAKQLAQQIGADLCGIAPASRFSGAPEGFRPTDIYPACESVVALAKRIPHGILLANTCIPYTAFNNQASLELDMLTAEFARRLDELNINAVPVPSDDPYEYWESENLHGRGIVSMRHVGYLAGLGTLGRNTLLRNTALGNMIQIGAILTDVALDADPIAEEPACPPNCRKCLDACPVGALDGTTANQKLCRQTSFTKNARGFTLRTCHSCRSACPYRFGDRR